MFNYNIYLYLLFLPLFNNKIVKNTNFFKKIGFKVDF